jgi:hypothetical protein
VLCFRLLQSDCELKKGDAMNTQIDHIERREHPRNGVMGHLEDITYSALRRYGVIDGAGSDERNCSAQAPRIQ